MFWVTRDYSFYLFQGGSIQSTEEMISETVIFYHWLTLSKGKYFPHKELLVLPHYKTINPLEVVINHTHTFDFSEW